MEAVRNFVKPMETTICATVSTDINWLIEHNVLVSKHIKSVICY